MSNELRRALSQRENYSNMDILQDLARMLKMADSLSWYAALPLYLIGYGLAVWTIAKAVKAIRDAFK
ncbi:hypothetical protein [uncultured Parasutterella sp.]|uniref:hypothetical protein n=1 Tax=uncultured Parasutterella sp. TaxID=1263098 RepID=UPI0025B6D895|nr:hypothetical protein [uncultured Parasutterella sp.]